MLLLLVIAASHSTFSQNEIKREASPGEGSSRIALEKLQLQVEQMNATIGKLNDDTVSLQSANAALRQELDEAKEQQAAIQIELDLSCDQHVIAGTRSSVVLSGWSEVEISALFVSRFTILWSHARQRDTATDQALLYMGDVVSRVVFYLFLEICAKRRRTFRNPLSTGLDDCLRL
jgi:hypothetical protein